MKALKPLWLRLQPWLTLEIALLWVVGARLLPGGEDLYRYYVPFARGCLTCGFVPPPAQWILWPLRWLSPPWGWTIWVAFSLAGWWAVAKASGNDPGIMLLTFPAFGEFWLGQTDVLIALGLLLAMRAPKGWQRGVGVLLALMKPQLSLLALLVLFLDAPPDKRWGMVSVPLLAFGLSLAAFGPLWPVQWWHHARTGVPQHVWRLAGQMLWPYGLLTIPIAWRAPTPRRRFLQSLYATALASPFFSVYAYLVFLAFEAPWWSVPLSFAWVLGYPWLGAHALKFAWVLPAALLVHSVLTERHGLPDEGHRAASTL